MTPETLLGAIRDGDYHRGGLRCLRLFNVDRELARALRSEALQLCETERGSDVQEREHVSNWVGLYGAVQQFSLLNRSGDFADYLGDHDFSPQDKHFHHAARYPGLASFIAKFPGAINFRLNVLGAGAGLRPHEEHSLYSNGDGTSSVRARFHLPLCTSRAARMTIDGHVHHFRPRTIYYFNQGCVHSADNGGGAARIHLIWDMLLTREVCQLMFGDTAQPHGLQRIAQESRPVRLLGNTAVRDYARLPPRVTPQEASRLVFARIASK